MRLYSEFRYLYFFLTMLISYRKVDNKPWSYFCFKGFSFGFFFEGVTFLRRKNIGACKHKKKKIPQNNKNKTNANGG